MVTPPSMADGWERQITINKEQLTNNKVKEIEHVTIFV
jgi:hypothetical protein